METNQQTHVPTDWGEENKDLDRFSLGESESVPKGWASRLAHQWPWIKVSASLLLIYLGFFHLCLGSSYLTCNILGVVSWLAWVAVCVNYRSVFLSRFERGIYHLVGVDILLEGFSPLHQGYGFYVCASSFWAVFIIYRLARS